ncbi:hypothetical protein BV25DRAFT_1793601 [Artomyces pyxidatus]|uniref:Uncharacterized protein n=1 Tax=Artomyces pyxidatus TaxID=48021 RepID=A0ACB8TI31_9AGAM|nr:hypothetical protein BV25DRAFT_1793601 [Artomyces pyxidatus]
MARRPSAVSLSSTASSSGLPHVSRLPSSQIASPPPKFRTPTSPWPPRAASLSAMSQQAHSGEYVDPDELFTKYTVAEVRSVQQRLRCVRASFTRALVDADAKQEELRLMVGERYRDLLQASSSIISIAESSKAVLDALDEMKTSIPSPAEGLQLSRRSNLSGKDDTHLKVLQSLAAHMKLLLDTPEHLWRLLEKKKYLHAGWLFLLARVIHRALVREDTEDEDSWKMHGIDVLEQFPLVQRQWETVAQFRSQITYKATLSLREFNASVEDICSVLLMLHLLESRPLADTLSTFLSQRTRSLQTALSRNPKGTPNGHPSHHPNGNGISHTRKTVVREAREGFEAVLEVLCLTVGAARDILRDNGAGQPSLMRRILEFIQSDSTPEASLPPDLQMSTQYLLGSLPSSSHFVLLPSSIRSYKPYVDLTSSTSSMPQSQLSDRLQDWFQKGVQDLQTAAESWLADLQTLKEVWTIRTSVYGWVDGDRRMEDGERTYLKSAVDVLVHKQAAQIWRSALNEMEEAFRSALSSALSALQEGTNDGLQEITPAKHLFQSPPAPSAFDASAGSTTMVSSFRKYESALRRQVGGRTPLLDAVMGSIESHSAILHHDFQAVCEMDAGDSQLMTNLTETYQPLADQACNVIVEVVSSSLAESREGAETDLHSLAFLSRLTDEMCLSPFLADLRLGVDKGSDSQGRIRRLHDVAIDRWRKTTVTSIVRRYREACIAGSRANHPPVSTQPSPALIQALVSLSDAVQTVGTATQLRRLRLADHTLKHFMHAFLDILGNPDVVELQLPSIPWDLKLLRKLADLWGPEWVEIIALFDERLKSLIPEQPLSNGSTETPDDTDRILSDFVSRSQILFAPLLPPSPPPTQSIKPTQKDRRSDGLLLFGMPAVEQQVQPAMELVKPGPRFGLLLVGSTSIR